MAQHSKGLGILLVLVAVLVGHAIAQALASSAPAEARMYGAMGGGVVIAGLDLALRRFWGEGEGVGRYLIGSRGPAVSVAPGWVVGIGFILIGLGLRD